MKKRTLRMTMVEPKKLYEDDVLTIEGEKASIEFHNAFIKVFADFASKGYSIREIGHVAHNEVTSIEAVSALRKKVDSQ
jgi:hypothetical protein